MTDDLRVLALIEELAEVNRRILADLRAILAETPPLAVSELRSEPTATADSMTEGGWMRLPGSPRWRQIKRVHHCNYRCRRIDFDTYPTDKDGTYVHVDPATTYPFLTDEQFQADCDAEQAGRDAA